MTGKADWLPGAGADGRLRDPHLADVVQVTRARAAGHRHAGVAQLHLVSTDHVTRELRLVDTT